MKLTHIESHARLDAHELVAVLALEGDKPDVGKELAVRDFAWKGFLGEFRETRSADAAHQRVLAVGLGKAALLDTERLRRLGALVAQKAESAAAKSCALIVPRSIVEKLGAEAVGTALAEGALLGSYRFEKAKSKPKPQKLETFAIVAPKDCGPGIEKGRVLAEACAFTRDLQNEPANRLTPKDLAAAAKGLVKTGRITCTVHDEKALEKLGMGLLLGVAAGSRQPPRLVHLVYKPKGKSKGRVALVGKGLTFDSGGISIKPAAKMDEMRFDMSGGAAVLGVFHALRSLDVPYEVHGLVGATENMPGDNATKPGDIHVAMNGTTVEVLNTDAEGRLVLADVLCYAGAKVKPDVVVDLATLTGAVVTALGHEVAGMFASTPELEAELRAAGDTTGERLWPLPLLDVHKDAMKGTFADLKNISGGDLGAGSSAGAAFLVPFVPEKAAWAHLDIAGVAWGGSNRDWVGGQLGSGFGTRLLVNWLETR
ncbi:MAG: leucyl aminopeptidase family protein [Planctomycetota bacterium]|nr:leucyl aminopeptidase family protein [Planctomycetota bacterium]